MTFTYKNIYALGEKVRRDNLADYFWPVELRNYDLKTLFLLNKREAWFCDFLEKGLFLDLKILISKTDYADWPQDHRTQNINTVKRELIFHEQINYKFSDPVLSIKHQAEDAEAVRKHIYISKRFGERAHNIWAGQYFEPTNNRKYMFYVLGFNRAIEVEDTEILIEIKKELSFLKNVSLL